MRETDRSLFVQVAAPLRWDCLVFSFGAAQARLAKKEAAQRMMVVMEVKPWEAEQDLNKLWKKITTEVAPEGLKWGEGCNLVDVAFGIKKIVMSCVVNMTVSTDDVVEQMQETYEDEVQSIDVISMNVL